VFVDSTLETFWSASLPARGVGMMEMVIEAIVGKGFWAPLRFIASVFTLGKDTDPSFSFLPVVVGLMGHMMNSVIFGLIFALVISRIVSGVVSLVLTGMAYAAAIFAAMWFVVLPLIDPAMLLLNSAGFFLSHLMYGLLLGLGSWLVRERTAGRRLVAA